MADNVWQLINYPVPDGLDAAGVQAFLANEASKLNNPPKKRVLTADEYLALPNSEIIPGVDPSKAFVSSHAAVIDSGTGPLYMCHNKG
jgi:hypothetical protein